MHTPDAMAYLQDGLRDMLASRLAANGGATIIEHSKVDALVKNTGKILQQQEALALARQLGVDFIVSGSLTSFGGSMSIDTKVFGADSAFSPASFYATANRENEIIGAVNQLSWDIAAEVLGATPPASLLPAAVPDPQPSQQDDSLEAFKTDHPEKIYRSQDSGLSSTPASPIIMSQAGAGMQGFSKTQNLDFKLQGMDVGDVDGDGQSDVVLADKQKVYVYRLQNNRLVEFGSVGMPARSKIHAVSLGDIDKDGRAEIYISAADDYNPYSWAYEWDGSRLDMVLDDIPWYIRVIDLPQEGPVLVGQRGGQDALLRPGIFRLMQNGSKVIPEGRLTMPDYINLFEFALGDVTGDGAYEVVAISRADRLYVVRPDGSVLWVSDEFYSGTSRYIGEDYDLVGRVGLDVDSLHSSQVDGIEGSGKRKYIPSRLVITDVNGDGRDDVIVNKNFATASRHVENFKHFKSGEIHAMSWNGIALGQLWQTKKIDGYIPDFQFLPLQNGNNRAKLYVGLVIASGWTGSFVGGESTILTYDIELAREK
ncbi:MAG: FG-GAP-like repeat-containing protein [Desulfobulbales bacterium]|nr:FG-GAP-like repeat-containing protein [Desulfobulbales bacterium]